MLQPPIGSFEQMLHRRKSALADNNTFIRKKFNVGSLIAPSAPPVPLETVDVASPLYVKKSKRVASVSKAAYPGMAGFVPEYEVKT